MSINNQSLVNRGTAIVNRTFESLQYPNYRLWFLGQMASLVGTWMQSTAQGYLIYDLTHSAAFLGYVSFASGLPTWMLTLYGGVVSDYLPKRTLIMITQALLMIQAFLMAVLVFTGMIQPWMILVFSFFSGIINSFDLPARQAFVSELIEHKSLTNAIALNGIMFNGAIIFGPTIGSLIYAWGGPGWCFTINGISFLAVLAALLFMRMAPQPATTRPANVWKEIKTGINFVRNDETILWLIISIGVISAFGFCLIILLPAWATDVLHGDVRTNGLLASARGVGAVIGALTLAAISYRGIRGQLWSLGSFLLPAFILAVSAFRVLPFSLIGLIGFGWALMMMTNNTNAMVQSNIPDELRGRVMGIYSLVFVGSSPIGSLLAGWAADWMGVPAAVAFSGAVLLAYSAYIILFRRCIRVVR